MSQLQTKQLDIGENQPEPYMFYFEPHRLLSGEMHQMPYIGKKMGDMKPLPTKELKYEYNEQPEVGEYDYRETQLENKIPTILRNALNNASASFERLGDTGEDKMVKARLLIRIGENLGIPPENFKLKPNIKKYVDKASALVSKAHIDKHYTSLIDANKAINELRDAITGKTRIGSGIAKANRIELIKGEIKAGNTNKYLKQELRHLLRNKKK